MDGERTQLEEETLAQSSESLQIDSENDVKKLDEHQSPTTDVASTKYVPPHKRSGFRPTTGEEFSRARQETVSAAPLTRKLQHVSIGDAANRQIKRIKFQRRPGVGTGGAKCVIRTNHFMTDLFESLVHQYDVAISPEVSSQRVNRAVISEMVKLYRESHLGKRIPAYDGRKSMFTLGALPFLAKEFRISLSEEDDAGKEREFCVFIKMVACVDLTQIGHFLRGSRAESPHEALQVLDVALRALSAQRYCPVGRSFYSPLLGKMQALGNGVQSWAGFYQSIRPTQMGLSLNIDMSATPFYEPVPVHEFVGQFLNRDVSEKSLTDTERFKIKKVLKGLKVEVIHRGKLRRKFRVSGLTNETARDLKFPDNETGNMKSMVEHFQEAYGYAIQEPDWPCLIAGNPRRPCQLPMEVCRIVGGQRFNKKLNEKQVIALLRATCQRPHDRELDIRQIVNQNAYKDDPYAKEFGIEVDTRLTSIDARVLPAPKLKYHESGMEQDCRPHNGQWNMKNKKLIDGGVVKNWICINYANNVEESVASQFCYELAQMCNILGMEFNVEPVLPCMSCHTNLAERALKAQYHDCMQKLEQDELDLLLVILPDSNGPLYGEIKRICEIELGLASQCCLSKHALKMNKHHLANMALKINAKVGGRNMVLEDALLMRIPMVSDRPTIIIGADVNHPAAGEDISPSIAAVVASQDWPKITRYASLVCTQTHRQEIIDDMFKVWEDPVRGVVAGGMIRELLVSFRSEMGHKPERIIFYRDGVSEGQFQHVLLYEIDAIRKACASLEPNYQPPITFVIVQKRHHTRMFPQNHYDHKYSDRSGNVIPGTVIDTKICHPTEFDFYLCSHAGVQGTSKPAHYHVLYDENNFTADDLQSLTNSLCYTYARCTRAVSIVPPAYYAHLAAYRARFYMEAAYNHNRVAVAKPTQSTSAIINAIRPLPSLKENAKKIIFY